MPADRTAATGGGVSDSEPGGEYEPGGHGRFAGATGRVARWSVRHPWWAVGLWVAFVVVAMGLGSAVETRQATGSEISVGESGRAERLMEEAELGEPPGESVLITPREGWDPQAAGAAAAILTERLAALPEVAGVADPVPSQVTDAVLVPVTLRGSADDADERIEPVLSVLAETGAAYPDLRIETVGAGSGSRGVNQVVGEDLSRAGLLSVPVTLAVLLVAFGAFIAAGVPVLLALSAVMAAMGMYAVASHAFPDAGNVPHVVLLIGLAVGVDYSLFYLKREREERRRGRPHRRAVEIAAATSGRAVVVSGVAVLVSMAGLYLAGDVIFSGLATGAILVVGAAVFGSLTVLPALLSKLGRAVDRPRVPLLWRLTNRTGPPRLWPALLRPALRRPGLTLLVGLLGMAALAAPALGMNLKSSSIEDLPRSIPVVAAYHRLVAAFPSEGNSHQVVVAHPAEQAPAVREALTGLATGVAGDPLFAAEDRPEPRTAAGGTVSTVVVPVPYPDDAPEMAESLERLRTGLVPAALAGLPATEHLVGGEVAENLDYTDHLRQRLPWVIGFVVGLTILMMVVAFRSVVVALISGLLNLVSVAASFGLLTLVFQNTWAEGLLGFTSTGFIVTWIPLFLFVVLFGLSMDYHVFVLSRIREAAAAGLDTRAAVRDGITRSAGVVTSAAVVMVAVFGIFGTLSLIEMKQLGIGLAAAIAIDATVVRIMLLPSVMSLLGRANWWPGPLSRRRPAPVTTAPAGPVPGALAAVAPAGPVAPTGPAPPAPRG